jgi:hypothetical protein
LIEAEKHSTTKLLPEIPSIGSIREALVIALLQTTHQFHTMRQLWTYIGFGIETDSSAEHLYVDGELQRSKKQISPRGRYHTHNTRFTN